ncbi:MAG: TlyA family RNA methyltransferase, partial [Myxococcota bacterium]
MAKERADKLLVARGLAPTRARAQALIMAGRAVADDRRIDKAGERIRTDCALRLKGDPSRYVSRGGEKLDRALEVFADDGLTVAGRICLDIGASTGGFTDCLLQRGAARVYAVDVGWGQLHDRLRRDARVDVRERTNARHLVADGFTPRPDLVVVDASFIGIAKLMPAIARVMAPTADLVALVKPQFEAGPEAATAGRGVIRDPEVRRRAIENAVAAIEASAFREVAGVDSPIRGPKGNLEYLVYARRTLAVVSDR